jgi:serine/threonine protein kinase
MHWDPVARMWIPMEAHVLQTIQHPNIVRFIKLYENSFFFFLVLELVVTFASSQLDTANTDSASPKIMKSATTGPEYRPRISSRLINETWTDLSSYTELGPPKDETVPQGQPFENPNRPRSTIFEIRKSIAGISSTSMTFTMPIQNKRFSSDQGPNNVIDSPRSSKTSLSFLKRADTGSLFHYIQTHKHEIQQSSIYKPVFRSLLRIYQSINAAGFVYLDFKAENILVTDLSMSISKRQSKLCAIDDNDSIANIGQAMIKATLIDFGMARPRKREKCFERYGTAFMSSPEIMHSMIHNGKSIFCLLSMIYM